MEFLCGGFWCWCDLLVVMPCLHRRLGTIHNKGLECRNEITHELLNYWRWRVRVTAMRQNLGTYFSHGHRGCCYDFCLPKKGMDKQRPARPPCGDRITHKHPLGDDSRDGHPPTHPPTHPQRKKKKLRSCRRLHTYMHACMHKNTNTNRSARLASCATYGLAF